MAVQYNSFYTQRILKERQAKDNFDKAVHLNNQMKVANTITSGFSAATSSCGIIRNRVVANQEAVANQTPSSKLKKALFFINTSNGNVPSNPNSLMDMGNVRNCEYKLNDLTEGIADRNVKWRDLLACDD